MYVYILCNFIMNFVGGVVVFQDIVRVSESPTGEIEEKSPPPQVHTVCMCN